VRSLTSTGGNTCGGDLSASPSVTLELRAVSDSVVRDDRTVNIDIMQVDTVSGQINNETVLDKFDVTVKRYTLGGLCKVVGDPHIFTFDQTKYDNMLTGEFLVYSHTELAVEVHGYFYVTGQGSSACGFAARVGNDVIKVSKCETRAESIHPVTVTMYLEGGLTPQVKVYQEDDGGTVKVYLPTGTLLEMRSSIDASMNLYVRPSAIDFGKTRGLCGLFDNNATNDLLDQDGISYTVESATDEPDDFSEKYRVSGANSIYSGAKGVIDISSETYCTCDVNGESSCDEFGNAVACSVSSTGQDITQTLVSDFTFEQQFTSEQESGRKKRQTSGGFSYTVPSQTNPTWPTDGGITQETANNTCTTGIEGLSGFATCQQFNVVDFNAEILNCMGDIKRTDSLSWAEPAIASVQASCRNWLLTNADLWQDGDKSNVQTQPTVTQTDQLCTNDCNGQGSCSGGVCSCSNGYSGSDCTIAPNAVPSILVDASNSLCASDLTRYCNRSVLSGENFKETTKIELTPITVTSSGITSYGDSIVVDPLYRSRYEILANMEDQQSYRIRVSNNGVFNSYSNSSYHVIYNSQCQECDFSGAGGVPICTQKASTCFIYSVCYTNGDENPNNNCQVCNSTASPVDWTDSSDPNCVPVTTATPSPTTLNPTASTPETGTPSPDSVEFNSRTVIIVAACVAGLLLIIIVVAAVIIIIRRRRARENAERLRDDSSDGGSHSHFERVFNGSYGLRTDKSLTFYNPSNQSDMNSRIYPTLYDNAY